MYSYYPNSSGRYLKRATKQQRANRDDLRQRVQGLVSGVNGPFIEVGGPTKDGFGSLREVHFPGGLFISNLKPNQGIDARADVRALPFKTRSLGGILVSCLTKMPDEAGTGKDGYINMGAVWQADREIEAVYSATKQRRYEIWQDDELLSFNQRIALLREARRTIEPEGLLVVRRPMEHELQIARLLGFKKVIDMEIEEGVGLKMAHEYDEEYILQLSNLDTPAGKYLESLQ